MNDEFRDADLDKEESVEIIDEDCIEILPSEIDWQTRQRESAKLKEERRKHFSNVANKAEQAKLYFRPAKPVPSIDDAEDKEVAVYARVSTASIEQLSSIENQTLYYTKKIEGTPNWHLHEIYSDEGKSGTSMRHRDAFKRMLLAAKRKEIDLIICASVSRFARNVSDCLEQVAELKTMNPSHPVGVFFETENIYTLNPDSDQALSVHALLADWESANKSRRMILSYDQRILTGQYPVSDLLGYRHTKEGELVVVPEEAKTVRLIFLACLSGYSYDEIAELLTLKRRATLRGRREWNGSMVANIMTNERRWGDLEARKTIVVNYKKGKTAKNNNERCSAYVPEHHEAIVSPEIARAVGYLRGSTRREEGLQEFKAIRSGALKGFLSIAPSWNGVNADALKQMCLECYSSDETNELYRRQEITSFYRNGNVTQIGFQGYQVSPGICYLTKGMPDMTISTTEIRFNAACHARFDNCSRIEILYHPILCMIVIREGGSVDWGRNNGKMSGRKFCGAIYENMRWKKEYKFRFRGITKERDGAKMMIFYLDEPQILLTKSQRQKVDSNDTVAYIPYEIDSDSISSGCEWAFPDRWASGIGMSLDMKENREKQFSNITSMDITEEAIKTMNPLLGYLPERSQIEAELKDLLHSM